MYLCIQESFWRHHLIYSANIFIWSHVPSRDTKEIWQARWPILEHSILFQSEWFLINLERNLKSRADALGATNVITNHPLLVLLSTITLSPGNKLKGASVRLVFMQFCMSYWYAYVKAEQNDVWYFEISLPHCSQWHKPIQLHVQRTTTSGCILMSMPYEAIVGMAVAVLEIWTPSSWMALLHTAQELVQ
jgi:hypothetical protein